jgi:hypothetical protein
MGRRREAVSTGSHSANQDQEHRHTSPAPGEPQLGAVGPESSTASDQPGRHLRAHDRSGNCGLNDRLLWVARTLRNVQRRQARTHGPEAVGFL